MTNARFASLHGLPVAHPPRRRPVHFANRALVTSLHGLMDDKLSGGNRKARKLFITNIWYQEHDVVVSVSVVGKDLVEIVAQLNLIGVVHSNALHYITEHGVSAPVHHYKIENGQVNAAPMLLERVDQAMTP